MQEQEIIEQNEQLELDLPIPCFDKEAINAERFKMYLKNLEKSDPVLLHQIRTWN